MILICYSIRGALSTIVSVGADFGTLLAFALGTYCNYNVTPIAAIAVTVLYAVLFLFFPETPIFLLKQNQILVCMTNDTLFILVHWNKNRNFNLILI